MTFILITLAYVAIAVAVAAVSLLLATDSGRLPARQYMWARVAMLAMLWPALPVIVPVMIRAEASR